MSFTLKINGESHIFEKPIKLKELNNDKNYIACLVNGRIRELDYDIHYDAEVKFLTTKDSWCRRYDNIFSVPLLLSVS